MKMAMVNSGLKRLLLTGRCYLDVFTELDDEIDKLHKKQREYMNQHEHWKVQERENQEKLNDDSKTLEKMTNKQSLLLKKVKK